MKRIKRGPLKPFRGKVYDIDFIQSLNWCQVILQNDAGPDTLIAVTSDGRMQSILEASMIMQHLVEVEYEEDSPNRLTRAKINRP